MLLFRWAFAIVVYYANHAVNFLLYCVSGAQFRRHLLQLVHDVRCRCELRRTNFAPNTESSSQVFHIAKSISNLTAEGEFKDAAQ